MPRTRPYSATTRSIMAVAILLLAHCGTRLARGPPLHPQPRNSLVSSPGEQVGLDGESLSGRRQAGEFERKPSFLSKGDRGFESPFLQRRVTCEPFDRRGHKCRDHNVTSGRMDKPPGRGGAASDGASSRSWPDAPRRGQQALRGTRFPDPPLWT